MKLIICVLHHQSITNHNDSGPVAQMVYDGNETHWHPSGGTLGVLTPVCLPSFITGRVREYPCNMSLISQGPPLVSTKHHRRSRLVLLNDRRCSHQGDSRQPYKKDSLQSHQSFRIPLITASATGGHTALPIIVQRLLCVLAASIEKSDGNP